MNEKILRIMALALEISPYNDSRLYTDKPRVIAEYSTVGIQTLKVTVARCYKSRSTDIKEVSFPYCDSEKRLDEIIEWLESVKAEG